MSSSLAFDFGRNWKAFSAAKVDTQRLQDATESLLELTGPNAIGGHSFLDIGCGSGLFSIAAALCDASEVIGFDISPMAIQVSQENAERFSGPLASSVCKPRFCVGNVLDMSFLDQLGVFDVVYAWGSLHHTGAMWQAIRHSAYLVKPETGTFVVAIYNHHWTSPLWKKVKRVYNLSPGFARWLLNPFFGALIYMGVWVTARQNPLHKDRGMDFWYDVIDWLGGYPYEYARVTEVSCFVEQLGFQLESVVTPRGGTGCNQFVFRRSDIASHHTGRTTDIEGKDVGEKASGRPAKEISGNFAVANGGNPPVVVCSDLPCCE